MRRSKDRDTIHERNRAVRLLKEGPDGIQQWNFHRLIGEPPASLTRVNLRGACLVGTDLHGVNLSGSDLRTANLRFADLQGASLFQADLRAANLEGCDLRRADFRGARLADTNLAGSRCRNTVFADTDLSQAVGLDTIEHEGPSSIALDTLLKSFGRIPGPFLSGCGVPLDLAEKLSGLVRSLKPAQYHTCFVSYASKDETFARKLVDRLIGAGLRVWIAYNAMRGGVPIAEQVGHAIRDHDKLLLVLSHESMRSPWVRTEVLEARRAERELGRRKLFPIRLGSFDEVLRWSCFDPDTGIDVAAELRGYFIPNFSEWPDPTAFEYALARLLADLEKADSTPPA